MKIFRQLAIIFGVLFAGHLFQNIIGLPIPGTIIGMIILLACLMTGIIKIEMIEDVSKFLLEHITFFFIPPAVGIISSLEYVKDDWLPITIIITLSTIIVIGVTGLTVQGLKKLQRGDGKDG
ncbi:CidA/LrgA family protein [Anaerosalibacter bizertensis]|uniref:CidA/LrgA family protein n=1 Tax=Anaerosalibacter bizertensis TaxID=932217 RepID=A0A844FGN0_9FIRM|nr:CidA/LrgA family protein [Anaerosalibacter bizertensis]MBV1819898.1 CidA/LrgA family protein [Bacteroidales bacterium MSK.15.36]HHV25660.1 CidA/LrgA family protein [Tissierellia bacterium]MBU5292558.1 CidA/LrgA family protein [Anaerosalibacter bizertensis]MCB5559905.1 CidA/LrgA family protein [Anaerosalibacter bizertensis]MCG4565904.1 CidA/LrgA family protein [Anaerosalibacter bizertensis]